jgi:hypothetical protein
MAMKLIELTQAEYDQGCDGQSKGTRGGVFGDIDMRRMKLNVRQIGLAV